ncbi:MAG: hypothetical protein Q8Q31_04015 [Nanoarchaeota archaeon]|nr:hypothetical protein [Nanoarchaeota archaeon]
MKGKNILIFTIVTVLILLVPLIAMQFTSEVVWSLSDFVVAGVLLFGAGLVYEFLVSRTNNKKYRIVIGLAVLVILVYIWAELAVSIFIGGGS